MQGETWRRVEELFEAAIAKPPESREQFLKLACPDDPALRAEVLSLLNSGRTADSFLEDSPLGAAKQKPQLARGRKLGDFEIVELIGRGGMGEVYRARDTTLKRDVAIKVVPEAFLRDPERMARFQREAEVLASLNHPNIGHIYGIVDSENGRGLVLGLIEGPTLADCLEVGPIPLDEAVAISKQ